MGRNREHENGLCWGSLPTSEKQLIDRQTLDQILGIALSAPRQYSCIGGLACLILVSRRSAGLRDAKAKTFMRQPRSASGTCTGPVLSGNFMSMAVVSGRLLKWQRYLLLTIVFGLPTSQKDFTMWCATARTKSYMGLSISDIRRETDGRCNTLSTA